MAGLKKKGGFKATEKKVEGGAPTALGAVGDALVAAASALSALSVSLGRRMGGANRTPRAQQQAAMTLATHRARLHAELAAAAGAGAGGSEAGGVVDAKEGTGSGVFYAPSSAAGSLGGTNRQPVEGMSLRHSARLELGPVAEALEHHSTDGESHATGPAEEVGQTGRMSAAGSAISGLLRLGSSASGGSSSISSIMPISSQGGSSMGTTADGSMAAGNSTFAGGSAASAASSGSGYNSTNSNDNKTSLGGSCSTDTQRLGGGTSTNGPVANETVSMVSGSIAGSSLNGINVVPEMMLPAAMLGEGMPTAAVTSATAVAASSPEVPAKESVQASKKSILATKPARTPGPKSWLRTNMEGLGYKLDPLVLLLSLGISLAAIAAGLYQIAEQRERFDLGSVQGTAQVRNKWWLRSGPGGRL